MHKYTLLLFVNKNLLLIPLPILPTTWIRTIRTQDAQFCVKSIS